MQERTLKSMAYIAAPLLTVALVAGAVSAAEGLEDRFERGERAEFVAQLTDEQREVLEEVRELREAGELDAARALAEEAEIPRPPHRGERPERGEHREAVKASLDARDYDAFVEATADAPFADQVDEEFFAKFLEAHDHFEQGRAILESLGIERPHASE